MLCAVSKIGGDTGRCRSTSILEAVLSNLRSPRLFSMNEASNSNSNGISNSTDSADSKTEPLSETSTLLSDIAIDESDPSKGTPTGWSVFNPMISVRVCHNVPHSQERVRELMFDCSQYTRWWPRTYSFDVERCTPDTIDSVIHFKSPVGHYKCRLTKAATDSHGIVRLRQNYFEGILVGDMEWQITRLNDASCKLCYDATLKPMSLSAQIAAAVSSREYLASYFEPLVVSLKSELKRQDAALDAATKAAAVAAPLASNDPSSPPAG
jgi:ribosome-associated toxin RatA of RatAB toxin-antitoxin module